MGFGAQPRGDPDPGTNFACKRSDDRAARAAVQPAPVDLMGAIVIRILVDGPDPGTGDFLRRRLASNRFAVAVVEPNSSFVDVVRRERPQIAVIDRVHERPDDARMKVSALKNMCPGVRVIIISEHPSEHDAPVVEQGVFYYLTLPVGGELIRIIEAGADALSPQDATGRSD
ncbi:MAG: hypothetical protein ACYS0G_00235 [Planctomycetota bacterium]|jgi:DNA-binding NtrC family response regulator